MNGNGKEYYPYSALKFEGEYVNRIMRNAKGYNKIGQKEIEIIEGKGHIKEYNMLVELMFEGEYYNGLKWIKKWKRKRISS